MHFFPVRYLLIQSIVTPWHNRVNYSMETHFDKAHSWARQNIPFPQNPHLFSEGQCRFDVMCGQSLRVEISLSLQTFWDCKTNYRRVTNLTNIWSLLGVFEVPPIVDSQVHRKFRGLLNLSRPVLQTMSSGEEHVSSDLQRERKVFGNL